MLHDKLESSFRIKTVHILIPVRRIENRTRSERCAMLGFYSILVRQLFRHATHSSVQKSISTAFATFLRPSRPRNIVAIALSAKCRSAIAMVILSQALHVTYPSDASMTSQAYHYLGEVKTRTAKKPSQNLIFRITRHRRSGAKNNTRLTGLKNDRDPSLHVVRVHMYFRLSIF